MKVKHTTDLPILLKLIPETTEETFKNGERAVAFNQMKIPHRLKDDGTLVLNIEMCPYCWKEFAEDRKNETWV